MPEHGEWLVERRSNEDESRSYRLVFAKAGKPAQLNLGLDPGPVAAPAPRRAGLVETVGGARRWLKARLREGAACPVCDQHAQVYRRKITRPMVNALVAMARAGALTGWKHMPTVVGAHRGDEAKLAYWGLLEEEKTLRPDGGRAGYWRITDKGHAFLKGNVTVAKYALVYNGECTGHEGDRVTVQDCMGHEFDLAASEQLGQVPFTAMDRLGDTATPLEVGEFARELAEQLYRERIALIQKTSTSTECFSMLDQLPAAEAAEVYAALAEHLVCTARGRLSRSRFRPVPSNPASEGADLMATVMSYTFFKDVDGIAVALQQSTARARRAAAVELCRYRQIARHAGGFNWS